LVARSQGGKKSKSKSSDQDDDKCYFCKKLGHVKDCKSYKAWLEKKGKMKNEKETCSSSQYNRGDKWILRRADSLHKG